MATAERRVSGADYALTYVGLLVLATSSLLLSFLHWPGGIVVSLTIAVVKALLVLWFFMHLSEQRFSSGLVMLVAVLFIALLTGLAAADVATRHTFPARPRPPGDESFYRR
jgi:cytochrome c oxidase subunit IV